MRRGRPRKICSHSFGPAKSGALWVKASCPKGKTSIKVFKGKTAGTVAGSGATLRAAMELGRSAYGFEISKDFYSKAKSEMLSNVKTQTNLMEFCK